MPQGRMAVCIGLESFMLGEKGRRPRLVERCLLDSPLRQQNHPTRLFGRWKKTVHIEEQIPNALFAVSSVSLRCESFGARFAPISVDPLAQQGFLRENNSDHQYQSEQKKNNKFQEHRYTPKYWKNEQNGVHQ
eukprot:2474403-Amphidinium_carterae.1